MPIPYSFSRVGAFWAHGHPFNISEPLAGALQTNNRAELTAVIKVLECDLRCVEIRSDSSYVVNGIKKTLRHWQRRGFCLRGEEMKNADLWRQLYAVLSSRGENTWKIEKVKGRTTAEDVLFGRVRQEDKVGNDQADALAVAGSMQDDRHFAEQERFRQEVSLSMAVQAMMLDIILERRKRTAAQDRGANTSASHSEIDSHMSTESEVSSSTESDSIATGSNKRRGRSAPATPE